MIMRVFRLKLHFLSIWCLINVTNSVLCELLIDCAFTNDITEEICISKGCIWLPPVEENAPTCIFPEGYGYSLTEVIPLQNGNILARIRRNPGQNTMYGDDVEELHVIVDSLTESIVRLKFIDPNNTRYEVPVEIEVPTRTSDMNEYIVNVVNSSVFGIEVIRQSTGKRVFNSAVTGFIYSNQFIQITTSLASSNFYGLGENRHGRYRHDLNWQTWTLFARDNPPIDDYNLYGVHPFYMNLEDDGNANGVFLLNSNAIDVILQPAPATTFRTVGGILDFFIFLGPSPEEVVQQYASVRGKPQMPPYWSLGFQICRWGYRSADEVLSVIERNRQYNLPYDIQCIDIDYMNNSRDFTISENFTNLPDVVDNLHAHNQKLIAILDPAISSDPGEPYLPLEEGLSQDIFVKHADGTILEGVVWPGRSYFPDFSNPATSTFWTEQIRHFYNESNIKFDGLWVDMDEPSNFVMGSTRGCEHNKWNYPPYPTKAIGGLDGKLYDRTLCMDAVQQIGIHYDVHSLYGHYTAKTTQEALRILFPEKRPFVLTRSQFAGSGRYAVHWLGDNTSQWRSMRDSIPGIMEFNLFGIPMVGADICGFVGTTTEELCLRWMQLGSFYPFSRNHNSKGFMDQDPASLGGNVIRASVQALRERYKLLPYLYTLFYRAALDGSTVLRPLLHEFSRDNNTWDIDFQFLWGPALLISPVVEEGMSTVTVYFPGPSKWYDYYQGTDMNASGTWRTIPASTNDSVPLHIRGGYIIPTQVPDVTTVTSRKNPAGLLIGLDENSSAQGFLFWDDGISLDSIAFGNYFEIQFAMRNNEITTTVVDGHFQGDPLILDTVTVYGFEAAIDSVIVDEITLSSNLTTFDDNIKKLHLSGLNLPLSVPHLITIMTVLERS